MKKAIALLLALVTLLSLTACAGKEDTASSALDQIKQKGGAGGRHLRGLPTL